MGGEDEKGGMMQEDEKFSFLDDLKDEEAPGPERGDSEKEIENENATEYEKEQK